jgi:hypothetical protein
MPMGFLLIMGMGPLVKAPQSLLMGQRLFTVSIRYKFLIPIVVLVCQTISDRPLGTGHTHYRYLNE